MMRLTWATVVAILISAPTIAQQPAGNPAARVASKSNPAAPIGQPFPALSAAERAQLTQVLAAWETQSKSTKTLDGKFTRWHYDPTAGDPRAKIHANRADGMLKYAAPDKGLFFVESMVSFAGMKDGKAQYQAVPGEFGEWWVCDGQNLIEFDRNRKECRIQELPPDMRGQRIIDGPLPFVFNLDAKEIQERYWVRLQPPPQGVSGIVLVEAHPRRQQDRAQYKFVQIALDQQTMLPRALIMYAPNFDPKNALVYDHYEFTKLGRNKITAGFQKFLGNFIPQKPPADWKIIRNNYVPPAPQSAQQPGQPGLQQQQGIPQQGIPQRSPARQATGQQPIR